MKIPSLKDAVHFVKEREAIRLRKERGEKRPWTSDNLLHNYRFCCPDRNDDRVTQWIHSEWLVPHEDDPYLWFAMVVARLFNLPFTLNAIGYPVPWKPAEVDHKLYLLKAHGNNIFNAAYIVSTNGRAMDKVEYLIEHVLNPMWTQRKAITKSIEDVTLHELWNVLHSCNGMGSFMAAQVVADLKQAPPFDKAEDWETFAAMGPGSKRGLNRIMGRPVNSPWRLEEWKACLLELRCQGNAKLPPALASRMCAQNWQNVCCETDKMLRARTGEGTPKQIYKERR